MSRTILTQCSSWTYNAVSARNPARVAVKYLLALIILASGTVTGTAQYIMQPSLGGTYSYGPESKPEDIQPVKRKTKQTGHRRAVRNQQDRDTRQPPSPLPKP